MINVRTTEPDRELSLVVGEAVALTDRVDEPADGELALPAEALLRLVYGRLDVDHTPDGVSASGAVDLDGLRQMFPGF